MSADVAHRSVKSSSGKDVTPATTVELSVSCRNIRDADVFSKSDPMCVLYIREVDGQRWREFGRTETIQNTLNPDFAYKFEVDYIFEEKQYLRFEIYDVDSDSDDLSKHDALGCMECTLGNAVSCMKLERDLKSLKGKKARGKIIVISEEIKSSKELVTLQFAGKALDKKDVFGKSDPFLELSKLNPLDGSYVVVKKTEVIKMNLNPEWRPVMIPASTLCNGDYSRKLKVTCYDWNRNGSHSLIGEFTTDLKTITTGSGRHNEYKLINEKKLQKDKKYTHSGMIVLKSQKIETKHTFLEFIQGGMQVQVTVGIDFSASNGPPTDASSLHHLQGTNQYASTIRAVVEILEDYDSDKKIPTFGFGAKIAGESKVSDIFPLNDNMADPECDGMEGVLQAYLHTLSKVKQGQLQLSGPTHFEPLIAETARQAAKHKNGSVYHILLILTDGEVNDMAKTMEAIINACRTPLSIIIVGIGEEEENFEAMKMLDGDNTRLSYNNRVAHRDIVQFVEMRDFQTRVGVSADRIQSALAREVLREVPEQVIGYMRDVSIHPKSRQRSTLV